MMGNFETWNSNFRNELVKRDCLDVIKNQHDQKDKVSAVAKKNVAMFLNKSVKDNLLQTIEGVTAYDTYKELVDIAPDKSCIVRTFLAEVP